jgi:D-aspartate ligase
MRALVTDRHTRVVRHSLRALNRSRDAGDAALACVMGDTDLDVVRVLAMAGIPCAVVARADEPGAFSRHTRARVERIDAWVDQAGQVEALLAFAREQRSPPVLMYTGDAELLLVSQHRDRLADAFRFVLPEADLVESLVRKHRFAELALRLDLPVPVSRRLRPATDAPPERDLAFPAIVKPITRQNAVWALAAGRAKAVRIDSAEELRRLWSRLAETHGEILVQELIPGPETRIESYHAYIDGEGRVAGEFTGRKLRTLPAEFGHSTALTTTDAADVRALGRDVVERLGFTGLLKADFKRDPHGQLRLLEVNPRFTLWHHLGAIAGVNLPAQVYADLTGQPRPPVGPARPGLVWMMPTRDFRAARASGVSPVRWLGQLARCPARATLALDDPMPFVRGYVLQRLRRRAARIHR